MFGFLFVVFVILLVTCSEATMLLCYFHLCAEVTVYLRIYQIQFLLYLHELIDLTNIFYSRITTGGGDRS